MVVSSRRKPAPPSGWAGSIPAAGRTFSASLRAVASDTRPALPSLMLLEAARNRAAERSRPPWPVSARLVAVRLADFFQSLASGLVLPLLGDVAQGHDADQALVVVEDHQAPDLELG